MGLASTTLKRRGHHLAGAAEQIGQLSGPPFGEGGLPSFSERLRALGRWPLVSGQLHIFQVNVGYLCNQACRHCHVDAGPDRREVMTRRTMEQCVEAVASAGIPTVDITGGAPEMNPDFRWFVKALREAGVREVIVRSNLTILNAHERYSDLPAFFREHGVRVVSSLPFHARERTDRQRGEGVFDRSIEAIRTLNDVGYAMAGSGLYLDLVYNPIGAFLPTGQADLEKEFKERLWKAHQVHFDRLFCITNMPISRFLESLLETGNYEDYMERLVGAFNPAAVDGLMCRDTISVGWDGMLYDCDFNQMLRMGVARSVPGHVAKFDPAALTGRPVQVHQHCYGCTAGAGSSCQGEVVS